MADLVNRTKISTKSAGAFLALLYMMVSADAKVVTVGAFGANVSTHHDTLKHLPYANPDAKKGGVLSLAAQGTFDSLNPFIDKGVPAQGSFYLYDTLMAGSLDEVSVSYPQLAQKVTYDTTDDSWIIYHIHPKAKFWDGSPVRADDVKATFEAILNHGLISWRSYLSGILRIEVLDDYRIKFVFAKDANPELRFSVGSMPIFAKKSIDQAFTTPSLTPLMGSGAYQLGKVVAGRSVSYVRNLNYWGWALMVNQGRFNFDEIRYTYYRSDEVAFEAFKAGEYRFRIEKNAKLWATAYQFNAIKQGQVKQELVTDANPVAMRGLIINTRRAPFDEVRVRQALVLAFDFDWVNQALLYGQKVRLMSFFEGSELQAKGVPSLSERLLLSVLPLTQAQKQTLISTPLPPKTDPSGYHRHALLQARSLLLQAGLTYHQGKLIDKQGRAVHLTILVADETLNRVLLPYLANLKRLGITATIRQVDKAQWAMMRRRFEFDMTPEVIYQVNQVGAEQAYLWGSALADTEGSQNLAGVKDKAIDKVIERLVRVSHRHEMIVHTKVLDRLLQAGFYVVPLYGDGATQLAYYKEYHHPSKLPNYALGLEYWWAQ